MTIDHEWFRVMNLGASLAPVSCVCIEKLSGCKIHVYKTPIDLAHIYGDSNWGKPTIEFLDELKYRRGNKR